MSSSTLPLRLLAYVGCVIFALDLIAAPALVVWSPQIRTEYLVRGFLTAFLLHLGWLVFSAGMLALYVARIYKDSIGLPLYVGDPKHSTIEVRKHHE